MTLPQFQIPPPLHALVGTEPADRVWYGFFRNLRRQVHAQPVVSVDYDDSPVSPGWERVLLCDAADGDITVSLPKAKESSGRAYTVKKIDATANTVTVDGDDAETIDGAATKVLTSQWETLSIVCNGTAWFVT